MSKLSSSGRYILNQQKHFISWEGIRRNGAYRRDYEWFKSLLLKMGLKVPRTRQSYRAHERQYPDLDYSRIAFSDKWGVNWPCPPIFPDDGRPSASRNTTGFWLLMGHLQREHAILADVDPDPYEARLQRYLHFFDDQPVNCLNTAGMLLMSRGVARELEIPPACLISDSQDERHVYYNIRSTPIQNVIRLIYLEEKIERVLCCRKEYRAEVDASFSKMAAAIDAQSHCNKMDGDIPVEKTPAARFHLQKWIVCLRVWDLLSENPGLTFPQLAARLYPDEFTKWESILEPGMKNPVTKRVRDQNDRAHHLIFHGFMQSPE